MKFVFWLNSRSIHQAALIRALAERCPVTVAVEKELEPIRVAHGWPVPDLGNAELFTRPSPAQIGRILDETADAVHLFSGINVFPMVQLALEAAILRKRRIIVYSEPYRLQGPKGLLRFLQARFRIFRYASGIDAFLPTGDLGYRCFRRLGVPESKLFPWAYFTESSGGGPMPEAANPFPSLLFVGSIDRRKNVLGLVAAFREAKVAGARLDLAGTGPLADSLQAMIANDPDISYLGTVPYDRIPGLMRRHDILVLPSRFDGWGAVVNEALQNGLRCVVGDQCGSAVLARIAENGCVYRSMRHRELVSALRAQMEAGPVAPEERQARCAWAERSISGHAAAAYLESVVRFLYGESAARPVAPWLNGRREDT